MSRSRFDTGPGPSQRQLRVGELIRRSLAEVLQRGDVYDPDLVGVSVTVGEVRLSPDLKIATVNVMPLGGGSVETVIKALSRHKGELRRTLNKNVHLKFSPDLRFVADETYDQLDESRRLFGLDEVRRDLDED